ncbi:MAG TPA: nuclease-related domain-containing protein [Candidatus Thermoplasmatota archaeon]|nr:nuclease-related domain-containing protein [Candidatus Thermoplasmatota archaeon]
MRLYVPMVVVMACKSWLLLALGHSRLMLAIDALGMTLFAGVLVAAYFLRHKPEAERKEHNLALGLAGERAVAQALESLKARGYTVVHDLKVPEGNVDHVVVGPAGLFVLETKTRSRWPGARVAASEGRLRVGGRDESAAVVQVRRNASRVRGLLGLHDSTVVDSKAVVVLPGWYVGDGFRDGYWVLNEKAFVTKVCQMPARLDRAEVDAVAQRLRALVAAQAEAAARLGQTLTPPVRPARIG